MKLGVLFSGGKDSTLATWMAKQEGHKISCMISIVSKNQDSYMFHTPSIHCVKTLSKVMNIPLVLKSSLGKQEEELRDLKNSILEAKKKYGIEGIITGAVGSVYQSSRVQRICNNLGLECFNPLWQRDPFEILKELVDNKFKAIVVGVAAYPLDRSYLGREINKRFIFEIKKLNKKFGISPSGEGGEFESLVIGGPLFKSKLKIRAFKDFGEGNSWKREIFLK